MVMIGDIRARIGIVRKGKGDISEGKRVDRRENAEGKGDNSEGKGDISEGKRVDRRENG
jgi:hypothetical protein